MIINRNALLYLLLAAICLPTSLLSGCALKKQLASEGECAQPICYPGIPPCNGYYSTCWRQWPSDCPSCPSFTLSQLANAPAPQPGAEPSEHSPTRAREPLPMPKNSEGSPAPAKPKAPPAEEAPNKDSRLRRGGSAHIAASLQSPTVTPILLPILESPSSAHRPATATITGSAEIQPPHNGQHMAAPIPATVQPASQTTPLFVREMNSPYQMNPYATARIESSSKTINPPLDERRGTLPTAASVQPASATAPLFISGLAAPKKAKQPATATIESSTNTAPSPQDGQIRVRSYQEISRPSKNYGPFIKATNP